jgi:hypothetical protein
MESLREGEITTRRTPTRRRTCSFAGGDSHPRPRGAKEDGSGGHASGENPQVISGDHRVHGILFARGRPFAAVPAEDANLVDIAPSVLHAMRAPSCGIWTGVC